jgi:hypothetical protein
VGSGSGKPIRKRDNRTINRRDHAHIDRLVDTWNWRARWFFNVRNRTEGVVWELQRIHQETGKEPGELGRKAVDDIREGLPNGHISFVEKAIVPQAFFNSIVGFVICAVVIAYIR